jgi:hypothetical protein
MAFVGRFKVKNMSEILFDLTHYEIVRILIRIKRTQRQAKIDSPLSASKPPLVPSL